MLFEFRFEPLVILMQLICHHGISKFPSLDGSVTHLAVGTHFVVVHDRRHPNWNVLVPLDRDKVWLAWLEIDRATCWSWNVSGRRSRDESSI